MLNEVVLTTSAETSLRGRSEMLVDVDAAQQQHQRQLMESSGSFNWSSASQSAAGRLLMRQDHARGSAESLVTKVSCSYGCCWLSLRYMGRHLHKRH